MIEEHRDRETETEIQRFIEIKRGRMTERQRNRDREIGTEK